MRWHLASTSYRVERDIRQRYFAHILTLPLGYFQQARTGDLMARATNDVEAVQRYLSHGFRMFLSAILGFSFSMVAMCLYDWELTPVRAVAHAHYDRDPTLGRQQSAPALSQGPRTICRH